MYHQGMTDIETAEDPFAIRASAHAEDRRRLRTAQRFQRGVTNLDVAVTFAQLEKGVPFTYHPATRRWTCPGIYGSSDRLTTIVAEMIRTGLLRQYEDETGWHLIPALTHYRGPDGNSACLFAGEDMGAMRSRLVDRMDLVDCLQCEAAVAQGQARGL